MRQVPATWPELRTAKDWLLRTLREHGIAVPASELRLGQEVDLEVVVRTFADKNQQACSRLRIARMVGEF